jgi:hypothetical protein
MFLFLSLSLSSFHFIKVSSFTLSLVVEEIGDPNSTSDVFPLFHRNHSSLFLFLVKVSSLEIPVQPHICFLCSSSSIKAAHLSVKVSSFTLPSWVREEEIGGGEPSSTSDLFPLFLTLQEELYSFPLP